jgi:hypothetical protein
MTSRTLGLYVAVSMARLALADEDPSGTYSALVNLGGEPAQLGITFTATGYATGTVRHQRQRHIVRGSMDALTLSANGQRVPLRVIRPHAGEANGFLSIGGHAAAFAAARRSPANIFAGRYTVITPAIPEERPKYLGGHGFGVMSVTPAGRFVITMRLADGQHFSVGQDFTGPLSASFVAAPNVSGSFSGKLKFVEIEDSSDADGVFQWVRDRADGAPPLQRYGFKINERLMASRYKPDQIALKGDSEPRGRIAIKGGILPKNSATAIYFDDGELNAPEYLFHSRFNEFSGNFSSALILPVYGVPSLTGGVIFQKQNRIYGMSYTRYGTAGMNIERKNEHLKD